MSYCRMCFYSLLFQLKPLPKSFKDLVFSDFEHDPSSVEGDPIVIKSDGYPVYHFANVVDDHHMKISHVLRGEEWLVSTIKHLQLYEAFGWNPPLFAHLPLLLNVDGSKISKRKEKVTVEYLKKSGCSPLALINFICSYGGGFDHSSGHVEKIHSLDELISTFSLTKLFKSRTRIDFERLTKINKMILEATPDQTLAAVLIIYLLHSFVLP